MQLLLDTCILYDWMMGHVAEPNIVRRIEEEGAFASTVSVWEMAIKHGLGKLSLPSRNIAFDIQEQGFELLNITLHHAQAVLQLGHFHKDPFDRLLIAQAFIEGLYLMTYDSIFKEYYSKVLVIK